jgi:hypothetical protein
MVTIRSDPGVGSFAARTAIDIDLEFGSSAIWSIMSNADLSFLVKKV